MFNCQSNLFTHSFNVFLNYNTRSNRNWWVLWTSTNFSSNEWNNLDKSLRKLKSLDKFKKAIRNVVI